MNLNTTIDLPARPMFFGFGFMAGAVGMLLLLASTGTMSYLNKARGDYERCVSDGGAEQRCVDKYLKGKLEATP